MLLSGGLGATAAQLLSHGTLFAREHSHRASREEAAAAALSGGKRRPCDIAAGSPSALSLPEGSLKPARTPAHTSFRKLGEVTPANALSVPD